MRTLALSLLFALAASACRATARAPASSAHDRAFWRSIAAQKYAPPAGADVRALALELADTTASIDPELRDELGFEISARWILRPGLTDDATARELVLRHLAHVHEGLGRSNDDSLFRRSFSALHLSRLVQRDLARPFLDPATRSELVRDACRVLHEERDRRGWVESKGWGHAIAHNADLLAALAREPGLGAEEQRSMLGALEAGLAGQNVCGENDRLAAVLRALVARPDFVEPDFERWLVERAREAREVWQRQPFDPAFFRRAENAGALVQSVLLDILLDDHASEGERRAADAIRAAFYPRRG